MPGDLGSGAEGVSHAGAVPWVVEAAAEDVAFEGEGLVADGGGLVEAESADLAGGGVVPHQAVVPLVGRAVGGRGRDEGGDAEGASGPAATLSA